jgi:flagellar biogenesis protein FliO
VLGVSAQAITTLHTMPPQDSAPPGSEAGPNFAQLLTRLKRGG